MKHILNQCPVVAILRNLPEDLLIPYAESILRGGISVFEVAMNTPDGAGIKRTFQRVRYSWSRYCHYHRAY